MYTVEIDKSIKTLMHPVKSAGTSIHTAIIKASGATNYQVHVNQRHAPIWHLPEEFRNEPKFVVVRPPHEWYKSFYRFFLGVEGYLSWSLNDLRDDGYIYPIEPDEFVRRMINMKDTLIKYPNKAKVFRNLLRSQANLHFITSYFKTDFRPDNIQSMKQFDMSLYDWFMRPMGIGTHGVEPVPMNRLDIIEKEFKIKIPHVNKTDAKKIDVKFSKDVINLIKETHADWYQMLKE